MRKRKALQHVSDVFLRKTIDDFLEKNSQEFNQEFATIIKKTRRNDYQLLKILQSNEEFNRRNSNVPFVTEDIVEIAKNMDRVISVPGLIKIDRADFVTLPKMHIGFEFESFEDFRPVFPMLDEKITDVILNIECNEDLMLSQINGIVESLKDEYNTDLDILYGSNIISDKKSKVVDIFILK